jgi:putative transposase
MRPEHRSLVRPAAPPCRLKGAGSNYKIPADLPAEPDDHGLGRSRGGLTTKVHALIDHVLRPVGFTMTAGHAGDNPQLIPLVDAYRSQLHQLGHGGIRLHLLADKAYTHPSTRRALRARRISHTIPERIDQIQQRVAKGSAGGRPPSFSVKRYARRNTVERGFNRLKQWRAIATRYDKYVITYLGGVTLAAILTYRR